MVAASRQPSACNLSCTGRLDPVTGEELGEHPPYKPQVSKPANTNCDGQCCCLTLQLGVSETYKCQLLWIFFFSHNAVMQDGLKAEPWGGIWSLC